MSLQFIFFIMPEDEWENATKTVFSHMDTTKTRWFHYKMLLIIGGGVFVDAYNTVVLTPGLKEISIQFHLDALLITLIGASVVLGTGIGALLSGYLADRLGRKEIFIADMIFFILIAGISAFSTNAIELLVLRILVGVGVGLDYPIASSYLSEFVPKKPRGMFMALDIMFYPIGALAAVAIGYYLLASFGAISWRYMLATALIPALIVLISRIGSPESPRWLMAKGRKEKAMSAVELAIGAKLPAADRTILIQATPKLKRTTYYWELLTKFKKAAAFLAIFYVGYQIAFVSVGVLSSLFAVDLGISVVSASVLFWVLDIAGVLAVGTGSDTLGRKPATLIGFGGSLIALALLILFPHAPSLTLLIVYAFLAFFLNWAGSLHLAFSAELVPTRIRATAEGWKQGTGRLIAVGFSAVLFPLLPFGDSLIIMFVMALAATLATIILLPEMKNKALEE